MAKFTPAWGLNETVAARFAAPYVGHVARQVEDSARSRAPEGKSWITMRDERVRTSHRHADGQIIPANLRYEIEAVDPKHWDQVIPGTHELAREPRDPNLQLGNRYACRCFSESDVDAVRRTIATTDATVVGAKASAQVRTDFPRIAEAHYAVAPDQAVPFMAEAILDARR
jgi:hypothetical protein